MSKLSSALKKGCAVIGIITVFLMTALPCFATPVGNAIQSSSYSNSLYTDGSGNQLLLSAVWTACSPYPYEQNVSQTNMYYYAQDFVFLIRFTNRTNDNLFVNYNSCVLNIPITAYQASNNLQLMGSSISELSGNLFSGVRVSTTNNRLTFSWHPDFQYGLGIVVPAKQTLYCYFVVTEYMTFNGTNYIYPDNIAYIVDTNNISTVYPTSSQISVTNNFTVSDEAYNTIITNQELDNIYNELVDQRMAYENNSSYASSVTQYASSVQSDIDLVHSQEESFYRDNSQALSDAGLANFDFDNSTKLGYQSVNEEFNRLWVALGRWNFIYVFTLLLSLVAYILRHRPWTTLGTHHDN